MNVLIIGVVWYIETVFIEKIPRIWDITNPLVFAIDICFSTVENFIFPFK